MSKDIKDYKHSFDVYGRKVTVLITLEDGCWFSEIIEGGIGSGRNSASSLPTLEEYIPYLEQHHRDAYDFHIKNSPK